jgi:hypothetical protein
VRNRRPSTSLPGRCLDMRLCRPILVPLLYVALDLAVVADRPTVITGNCYVSPFVDLSQYNLSGTCRFSRMRGAPSMSGSVDRVASMRLRRLPDCVRVSRVGSWCRSRPCPGVELPEHEPRTDVTSRSHAVCLRPGRADVAGEHGEEAGDGQQRCNAMNHGVRSFRIGGT